MNTAEALPDLRLVVWLSPSFPVGAFAYSHGVEEAVESGLVHDRASLEAWLADVIGHGSARQDAVLAAEAWRSAARDDDAALANANALALALAPSRERRLETGATGRAFVDALAAAWPEALPPGLPGQGDIAYPVAFGAACGRAAIALHPSLDAYGLSFAGNLVSAALRLGPIGQTDAQKVLKALLPRLRQLAAWASGSTTDDLGACALRSDIASLRHETLYSRLFRS